MSQIWDTFDVKAAIIHSAARAAIRLFPKGVRMELGKALFDLQAGAVLTMPLSRAMPSVSPGVEEMRFRDPAGIYRVLYYTRSSKGILVLHAFTKKTRTTPKSDVDLGKKRLKELLDEI